MKTRDQIEQIDFIQATDEVAKWIAQIAGDLPIVEVGTGNGRLLHLLAKHNRKVIGCDPHNIPEKFYPGFMYIEASEMRFIRDNKTLIVAARPSHGGWVTEIPSYMHQDSTLLYLGLSHNICVDWPTLCDMEYTSINPPGGCDANVALLIKATKNL